MADLPILLYESYETEFLSNGLGGLPDAIECYVTEERNGKFELEMVYPIDGLHCSDLLEDRIIFCKPSPDGSPQAFRIYKIDKSIDWKVSVYAEHISYQLSKIPVMPFSAVSCADALIGLVENAADGCPFMFWTDKNIDSPFTNDIPASIRSRLGGTDDSILEKYKGEYEWDNWVVRLWTNRGADRGVVIRYGKNLVDLKQETNLSSVYTGICPYWTGTDPETEEKIVVTIPEKVLYSEYSELYSYNRISIVDLSGTIQDQPTADELRDVAQQYMDANFIGLPEVELSISFADLTKTDDYSNIIALERVFLCDTVHVYFEELGISVTAKIVSATYDVVQDRYTELEIGSPKSNLSDTIASQAKDISNAYAETRSNLEIELARATNKITGGLGGHVVINRNADGLPNEILIMDTDSKETAVNVIRANMNGIGFSQTGYNGPFNSAWTIDGTLDMAQINVANLVADLIRGGTLTLGELDNSAGVLKLYGDNNALIGQMDKGGLKMYGIDNSYVLMNADVGFAGFDENDTKIFWADRDEFHMVKSVIEEEITLCERARFIPITIMSGSTVVNDGIGLIAVSNS